MSIPSEVKLEQKECPLGCNDGDEFVLTGHDMLHNLPGEFNVVRCRTCGLMRTNPRPSKDSIGYYYPSNYGPYIGSKVQKDLTNCKKGIGGAIKSIAGLFMDSRATRIPNLKRGRMLEIGCASGSFLHKMAKDGWIVEGIEFSTEAAKSARTLGYNVYAGPLETAPEPEEKFDLVVGWMVLEHLHDPIECLNRLHCWSNPDAWLVLSVPNAAAIEFCLFRNKWYGLHLPNHLYHFTPHTIEKALAATGWRLEKIYHQRVLTNIVVGLGYVFREKGLLKIGDNFINFPKYSGIWHYMLFPLSWLLSLFGQTGRMTI
ncbi:MAG: class I SAM-dependent methyltransferase, partial [Gammaproteobacteria bacterium]|nr:class I SAM-dependent methyltransferase [Gammaproteobacteria bacterium]